MSSDSAHWTEGSLNKVEIDVERHLLETTVRLSDASEGLVFSRGVKNHANLFVYNCHLCGVANLAGERCLQTHIAGRKHQRRLQEPTIDADAFRAPLSKPRGTMSIAPGEPVPPGFEDEVRRIPELQPFLDSYKSSPTIGLEYVVELSNPEENEPSYICLLCDKRGDPRTIIAHITSYNHRLKYLDKHFPSVVKEISPYRYNYEARNFMPRLVQTICEAIEDHHGRLSVIVHDSTDFQKNRNRILQEIIREKHFSEKGGPNFTHIIDRKKIDEQLQAGKPPGGSDIGLKRRDLAPQNIQAAKREKSGNVLMLHHNRENLDEISSSESDSPLTNRSPRNRVKVSRRDRSRSADRFGKRVRRSRSRSFSPHRRSGGGMPRVHRSPPFDKYDPPRKGPDVTSLSKKAAQFNEEKNKKEKFKNLLDNAVKELEKILKDHEKNPEKHPLYPEEWKTFWNRRYKELQTEKKDPNKYDYKPEWIVYWTKRMKELHLEAIEEKKLEIRKQCGLDDNPIGKLEVIDISDEETSPLTVSPMRSEKKREDRKSSNARWSRDREHDWERERSHSHRAVEPLPEYYPPRDYHPTQRYGVRYMEPDRYPKYEPEPKEEEIDDGPLTVVAVLRLLTALEDQLGSLGPKVIDLLAKALALEKIKPNSSDEMLVNEDNNVFFETVKEKLKGQLLAGVLDTIKIKAVKRAVKNIAAILHQVSTKEKPKEELKEPENPAKSKLLKTDILDRQLIASKLAAALVANEKTDISRVDMDRLINVFILMVKLSKERNSNVEVKDLLLELGIETNVFDEDDIISNISKVESKDSHDTAPIINTTSSSLDSLTDSDLQTLLQNFKHLSSEEQHHLIAHLKKLESTDPTRVEKLRKFVDVAELKRNKPSSPKPEKKPIQSVKSGFSDDDFESKRHKISDSDDDDDDYNFDDVVKAASNNIKATSDSKLKMQLRADSVSRDADREMSNMSNMSMGSAASGVTNMSLANTQNLIANLLGSLQQNKPKLDGTNASGNVIPTIGGSSARAPNVNPATQPQNVDNFYMQSKPTNAVNMNQQYPNPQIQQQLNMFENSFYPNSQGTQQQGFPPVGPAGMNLYNNSNMPNTQHVQNSAEQMPNSTSQMQTTSHMQNTPTHMQNMPSQMQGNFFNQFNPNAGQQHQMQQGNFPNPQNQQQNFFNRPIQNPTGYY